MDWSEIVKTYRQKNGLLQKQLAYEFGVDVMTVSRWERGITEPSKLQKGKLKDLVTARKSPINHPYLDQLKQFSGAVTVVNAAKDEYILCNEMSGLSRFTPEDMIGQHPARFFFAEVTHAAHDSVGGYSGALALGVTSFGYVVNLPIDGRLVGVEYNASLIRLEGYDPFFVHHRRRTDKPPTRSISEATLTYEDDMPIV